MHKYDAEYVPDARKNGALKDGASTMRWQEMNEAQRQAVMHGEVPTSNLLWI